MQTRALIFLLLAVWFAANDRVVAQDLPLFGKLPKLGENWKLQAQGKSGESWGWVVMSDAKSGDLLSFATHRLGPEEKRQLASGEHTGLIYLSDTSREIFPNGVWCRTRNREESREGSNVSVRNQIVKLDLPNSAEGKRRNYEVLEYTFIIEEEGSGNRMVNGYAFVLGDLSVFVQHTSFKPITDYLVQDTAYALITSHERQQAAAKNKPDAAPKPAQ